MCSAIDIECFERTGNKFLDVGKFQRMLLHFYAMRAIGHAHIDENWAIGFLSSLPGRRVGAMPK